MRDMMFRGLTTEARKYLNSEDIRVAVLITAADLERVLFLKLVLEKKINPELVDRFMLRRYIEWNTKLGLIDKSHENLLREFNYIRNRTVHERFFTEKVASESKVLEYVKKIILDTCDFIDSTRIKTDMKLERVYSTYLSKKAEEEKRFMEKARKQV
ncbi:MAG: hypothetical protein NT130_05340 [Candidatus Micrarchaeota archaeon]|nr:hypothetical protein [Candidatus Micrarchaeota archaeon]